jgi:hemoglobin
MIGEAELGRLIPLFYERVRGDPVLGPVFEGAVTDWPEHLELLQSFWSSVTRTTGRYKGNPMAAHLRHAKAITPAMFDRWLQLWRETAVETLPAEIAEQIARKAERIAESLKLGLFFRLGDQTDSAIQKRGNHHVRPAA